MDRAMSGLQPHRVPPTSTLIAFESAARHGNFSHAARELHTSQSAISRHMARLETQLGARLFERSRTGVRLTEAGRRFRDAVASGLGALRAGAADAATLSAEVRPEVAIACADEVSHLFLMARYRALREALGEHVRVRIQVHSTALDVVKFALAQCITDRETAQPTEILKFCRKAIMEPEEETRSGPETGKDDFDGISFHTTTVRDRLAHSRVFRY